MRILASMLSVSLSIACAATAQSFKFGESRTRKSSFKPLG
jgi:hypothetical protein